MTSKPQAILECLASAEAASAFLAWRKLIKKPLTERAAHMVGRSLAQIKSEGGDPDEALDLAQEHGWRTIKPDWYWNAKNTTGNRNDPARNINRQDTLSHTRDRENYVAARARRSPRGDCF